MIVVVGVAESGAGRPAIRDATVADADRCAAIYRPFVQSTAVTFESEPPDAAEMAERIRRAVASHAWLVAEDGTAVIGYAYGTPFASRSAYRWTCEVSVYVEPARHRTGTGRALYETLLARLAERGYRMAVAGIALPNAASEALHRLLGFERVGVYRDIGWKHGAWHDVARWQRPLGGRDTGGTAPDEISRSPW